MKNVMNHLKLVVKSGLVLCAHIRYIRKTSVLCQDSYIDNTWIFNRLSYVREQAVFILPKSFACA